MRTGRRWRAALIALTLAAGAAQGQILIGQTAGFSGPVAAGVKEITEGARLWIDTVNARGGVNGQQLELVSLDDKFDPQLTAENARKLIEERGVLALFLTRGTPLTEAVLPLLDAHRVPLVAPSTGAMVLHQPVRRHVFNGSAKAVADGVRALRAAGSAAQVVTLSNNASAGFIKALGDHSRGVIVSQVFPHERSFAFPMVKEALDLAKARGTELSPAMLEGYAAAKVLVEGVKRAGRNPTREKLQAALETMKRFDLGGLEVSFSSDDHTGLDFADLSIVDLEGRFVR